MRPDSRADLGGDSNSDDKTLRLLGYRAHYQLQYGACRVSMTSAYWPALSASFCCSIHTEDIKNPPDNCPDGQSALLLAAQSIRHRRRRHAPGASCRNPHFFLCGPYFAPCPSPPNVRGILDWHIGYHDLSDAKRTAGCRSCIRRRVLNRPTVKPCFFKASDKRREP